MSLVPRESKLLFVDPFGNFCKTGGMVIFLGPSIQFLTSFPVLFAGFSGTRYSFLYDDQPLSHTRVAHEILQMIHDISRRSVPTPSRRRPVWLHWEFPPWPFIKINVDGSARGNPGLSTAGIVLRDPCGLPLAMKGLALGFSSNVAAELVALKEGILTGLEFSFRQLILEIEFLLAIHWLKHQHAWPWHHFHILYELSELISLHHIQIVHTFREANSVADAVAKEASLRQQTMLYLPPSSSLRPNMSFSLLSDLPRNIRGLIALDHRHFPYMRC